MQHHEESRHVYHVTRGEALALAPWFVEREYWLKIEYASDGHFWLTCGVEPSRMPQQVTER